MNVLQLAQKIRVVNHQNGFGVSPALSDIPRSLALIHSEVSEAWEEMEVDKINREIGDVIVRTLDLIECVTDADMVRAFPDDAAPLFLPDCTLDELPDVPELVGDIQTLMERSGLHHALLTMHLLASRALECYRKSPEAQIAPDVRRQLWLLAAYCVTVLHGRRRPSQTAEALVLEIVQANSTRGYRHGGRRL